MSSEPGLCYSVSLVLASGVSHNFKGDYSDSRKDPGSKFSFAVPEGASLIGITFAEGTCTGLKLGGVEEEIVVDVDANAGTAGIV